MAVWIPQNLHERVKLETQMPLSARQYLINNPQYPSNMPPGYVLVPNTGHREVETVSHVQASNGPPSHMYVPVYPMEVVGGDFHMPAVRESVVKTSEVHKLIPGTNLTKEDLNRKVMSQLIENKMVQSGEIYSVSHMEMKSTPKSCLKKSVTFQGGVDFDSGISCTQTDDEERYEEKHDEMKEEQVSRPSKVEVEDDLETLEMQLPQLDLSETNDSGIEIESSMQRSPRTEPALLFSMPNHQKPKPRRPQSAHNSVEERRPPWRYFSKGGGGAKSDPKGFRETALKCPPQPRSQPIILDAELAFDLDVERPYTYHEPSSRPMSMLSTYDSDYVSHPTERPKSQYIAHPKSQYVERPQSQYGMRPQSSEYGYYDPKDHQALRSSMYNNSYSYPADNISPNAKPNVQLEKSPMLHAERIMYFDPQAAQMSSTFSTLNHSEIPVTDGPKNRKGVFRTVNSNGIKSDRLMLEQLLRNKHNRPHPPARQVAVPAHKKFATRDMVREAKETAYMEYRRMQVISREESFKDREESNQKMQQAKLDRCKKYAADVQRRDIQRQQDDQEKVNKTREAKRAVSFKIAERDQTRAERETDREQQRQDRLKGITQRRMEIEAQREREIQETIARRQEIKAQNTTARSVNHLEQIGDRRMQEAQRDVQMRHKEIQRREQFRRKEEENQRRKDLRLAVHQNKLMDLRSQVLP